MTKEDYFEGKRRNLDQHCPGWRGKTYPNGQRMFSLDGTMLNEDGNRSVFDDVDE